MSGLESVLSGMYREIRSIRDRVDRLEIRPNTVLHARSASHVKIVNNEIATGASQALLIPESGTSDDLDRILNPVDGKILILRVADSTYSVTVRHAVGNIVLLSGNVTLNSLSDILILIYNGRTETWQQWGTGSGGGGEVEVTSHYLNDTSIHLGTLNWAQLNKSGSNLQELTIRAHSSLTGIGPNDHHNIASGVPPISVSAGQAVSLTLAPTSGLYNNNGLSVKPSNGILLTSNGVEILLSAQSGLELVGTTPNRTLQIADTIAGNGLNITSKVMFVGAGDGITVTANAVSLTTPGTITAQTTNNSVGNHVHAVQTGPGVSLSVSTQNATGTGASLARADHTHQILSSFNPGVSASLLATSGTGTLQLVTLASNAAFFSGFAGSGYRVDFGVTETNKSSAEFDNLTVRGRMRVYELLIQQIRATNGSVFVSSSSKAEVIDSDNSWYVNGEQLIFNGENAVFNASLYTIKTKKVGENIQDGRDLYHGFLVGDLIRSQRFNLSNEGGNTGYSVVRQSNLEVTQVKDLYEYTAAMHDPANDDALEVGDDLVRLGNSFDTTRQGVVYLTADDSNAPFIDVVDGIASHNDWNSPNKVKVRLGKLTGITDSDFGGNLEGYGLYGQNVYLKGKIVVTGGNAATTDALDSGLAGKISIGNAAADVNANTTTIMGGKIRTGTIQSTNWITSLGAEGSEFNLDDGTFRLGGSTSPKLSWDGTTLSIVGNVTITNSIPVGQVTGLGALATANSVTTAQVTGLGALATADSVTTAQVTGLGALATANNVSWATQITGRPTELTDGRVATALDANGTVRSRVVPTSPTAPTPGGAGLYLGSDYMGYYNGSAWRSYMDNLGRFYLASGAGNALSWDGSSLSITGTVNVTGGNAATTTSVSTAISNNNNTNNSYRVVAVYGSFNVEVSNIVSWTGITLVRANGETRTLSNSNYVYDINSFSGTVYFYVTNVAISISLLTTTDTAFLTSQIGSTGALIAVGTFVAGRLPQIEFIVGRTYITGSGIVTGSIVANNIAALTITADKIAANAITASKISAGEINATHLSANAVTGDKFQATSYLAIGPTKTWLSQGIQLEHNGGTPRAYIGTGGTGLSARYFLFDGTTISWKAANTSLDANGKLMATDATIFGSITSTNGIIGGWEIYPTQISAQSMRIVLAVAPSPAIYSAKTTFESLENGWWIGTDSTDGNKPKFHFGNNESWIKWTGSALEIKGAAVNAPYITASWINLSYNSIWGTETEKSGGIFPLKYVKMGQFVFVMGWIKTNGGTLTNENATITKGLPVPDGSQFIHVRNGVQVISGGNGIGGYGDVVAINNTNGEGHMMLLVNPGAPIAPQNLIINGWYKAAF